jgi:hypothetical protein
VVSAVNRHRDQSVETEVDLADRQFTGPVEIFEVNAPDVKAENSFASTVLKTVQRSAKADKLQFSPSSLYDAEDEAGLMPGLILLQAITRLIWLSGIDKAIIASYFVTVLAIGFCLQEQIQARLS